MKVAIYNGRIPATTFIERLIEGLAEAGVEVLLFGEVTESVAYSSPNIRVLGWRGRYGRWVSLLKYLLLFLALRPRELFRLWRQLDEKNFRTAAWQLSKFLPVLWHRPEVFHLQWAKSLEEWAWVQHFGMKLVLSLRGAHINYSPVADPGLAATYRRLFPQVEGFHAVSRAIAQEARRYGAPAEHVHVVYSGLEADSFPYSPEKPQRPTLVILSVGRAHWKKGYTYALDACRLLKGRLDFHYIIVGGQCEEHTFHVHESGLEDVVKLTGPLPFEEVQRCMREADVLVLSSVEEGIANVVLEAMALGTPVISTDCGGMAEVIEDGVNGLLVPARDAEAMARALLRFAAMSGEERRRLAEAARRTIEERFGVEQMVAGMVGLYESTKYTNCTNRSADHSALKRGTDQATLESKMAYVRHPW